MTGPPSPENVAERKKAFFEALRIDSDIWVFGYGSLMWNPGFEHVESRPALLHGWHRSFCIYSHRYRGTPECPGLVLGLDRGGSCKGMAYRVARGRALEVMDYLWDREMVNGVYTPRILHPKTAGGHTPCHAYTVDRAHHQYAGGLPDGEMVRLIRQGVGLGGHNREYLANTVRHLDGLGINDGQLHRLLLLVGE